MNTPYWGTPGNWRYTDIENPPERTADMEAAGQFWIWLSGPLGAHFEVKGTGVRFNEEQRKGQLTRGEPDPGIEIHVWEAPKDNLYDRILHELTRKLDEPE